MAALRVGDYVETTHRITLPSRVIPRGSRGTVKQVFRSSIGPLYAVQRPDGSTFNADETELTRLLRRSEVAR